MIDSHPRVKHWVRNLERDVEGAFWLPVSHGKFFPDFVCELDDGRLLVVEYKGEHLRNVPTEIEKNQVGRVWAANSAGRCLFLMAFAKDERGRDVRGQLDAAIGARSWTAFTTVQSIRVEPLQVFELPPHTLVNERVIGLI